MKYISLCTSNSVISGSSNTWIYLSINTTSVARAGVILRNVGGSVRTPILWATARLEHNDTDVREFRKRRLPTEGESHGSSPSRQARCRGAGVRLSVCLVP